MRLLRCWLQLSSLKFLSEHSFDFNRLIADGCDYSGSVHPKSTELVGFDQVLLALCQAKCPLVGHNCLRELIMVIMLHSLWLTVH